MSASPPRVSLSPSCHLVGRTKRMKDAGSRDVYAFLGVPYAGHTERFQPPTPLGLWQGDREAKKYGAICLQDFSLITSSNVLPLQPPTNVSEQCFYLNVWSPTLDPAAKLPVMVFIHGGAFVFGFSNLYQGTSLATFHDVVFVSINYRLAAFGFMTTGDSVAPGNYGLLDQIEALKWIQKYIANFGGDPDNVTIIGESAGAMSVSWLVLSPLTRGLFRRAVSQSGSAFSPGFTFQHERASRYIRRQVKELGCTETDSQSILKFLRSLPVQIVTEKLGANWRPVIDGHVLPDDPDKLYREGQFQQEVDLMAGYNSHEGAMFTMSMSDMVNHQDMSSTELIVRNMVKMYFKSTDQEGLFRLVWKEYFPEGVQYHRKGEVLERLCKLLGELLLASPTERLARVQAEYSQASTYLYYFDHRPDFSPYPSWIKADHAMEIFFMTGSVLANILGFEFSQRDKDLSHVMMKYWVNFATSGNPNGPGLEKWPEYDPKKKEFLTINTEPHSDNNKSTRMLEFWQEIVPAFIQKSQSKL